VSGHDLYLYRLVPALVFSVGIGVPLLLMTTLFVIDRIRRRDIDRRYGPKRKSAYQTAEFTLSLPLRPTVNRVAEVFEELGCQVDRVLPDAGTAVARRVPGDWAPPAVLRAECSPVGPRRTRVVLSCRPLQSTTLFDYGAAVADLGRALEALAAEDAQWN